MEGNLNLTIYSLLLSWISHIYNLEFNRECVIKRGHKPGGGYSTPYVTGMCR